MQLSRYSKWCILIIWFLNLYTYAHSQSFEQEDHARYLKAHTSAELNVGSKMPDIPLGEVMNNRTGKTRFSQFREKLVILDFWNIHCGTCLEHMPQITKLREKFGPRIQIFLVDTHDTKTEIENFLKTKKFKLPDLPSIVNAKMLDKLFPTPMGNPHYVWIDGKGTIRLRGSQLSTYEEKINDFLAGKSICDMKDDNSSRLFERSKPYYLLLADRRSNLKSGSFFGAHNNDYAALNGGAVKNMADSVAGTVRNTFINRTVLELYQFVFQTALDSLKKKTLLYVGPSYMDYSSLSVKDTSRYTFDYVYKSSDKEPTDREFLKSQVCYEQITPISLSSSKRREYMLADLNRYYGNLYGAEVALKKATIPCFIIVRVGKVDSLMTKIKGDDYKEAIVLKQGIKMMHFENEPFKNCIREVLVQLYIRNKTNPSTMYFFDESGIKTNVDIELPYYSPDHPITLDDLRSALKRYGLDVIMQNRETEMVTIDEKALNQTNNN